MAPLGKCHPESNGCATAEKLGVGFAGHARLRTWEIFVKFRTRNDNRTAAQSWLRLQPSSSAGWGFTPASWAGRHSLPSWCPQLWN